MEPATIMLDLDTFVTIAFAVMGLIVIGPVAWLLRGAMHDLRELEKNHGKLMQDLPREYIRKDDHEHDFDEIKSMLDKIFLKLDSKADK